MGKINLCIIYDLLRGEYEVFQTTGTKEEIIQAYIDNFSTPLPDYKAILTSDSNILLSDVLKRDFDIEIDIDEIEIF